MKNQHFDLVGGHDLAQKARKMLDAAAAAVKIEVTTAQAGALAGIGAERIRQLTKDGWITRLGPNRYDATAVVTGVLAFKDDQIARLSRAGSNSKLQDARAADIEVRTAERLQRLKVEASEHALAVIDEFGGPLKADLMSMPARWTKDLTLRRRMDDEIDAAFGAAGERALAEANKDGMSRPDRPAPAAKRRRP